MRGAWNRRDASRLDGHVSRTWVACAFMVGALAWPGASAHAETGWVKDELRLNLRSGPGTQFRIIGVVTTGDSAEILGLGDGWTRVQANGVDEGWIPAGYLQPEPPARVLLERSQTRASELEGSFAALSDETKKLRTSNAVLSETDGSQKTEIERLTRENLELQAGARWPEWIAGACLLSAGMVVGAILHRNGARRTGPRIRL